MEEWLFHLLQIVFFFSGVLSGAITSYALVRTI